MSRYQGEKIGAVDLECFRSLGDVLERWALLSESLESLEIFSKLACPNCADFAHLQATINAGEEVSLDAIWASRMGYVAALLPGGGTRYSLAEALLSKALRDVPYQAGNAKYYKLLAEIRHLLGDWPGVGCDHREHSVARCLSRLHVG